MHKLHKLRTGWAQENSNAVNIVLFPVLLTSGKLSGKKSDLYSKLPWLDKTFWLLMSLVFLCLKQAFVNPEDTASFGKGESAKKYLRTDPDVERVRR